MNSRNPAHSDGQQGQAPEEKKPSIARKPYQFLKIDILREYLAMEFKVQSDARHWNWDPKHT